RLVSCSSDVVTAASEPPACSNTIFTGPTPNTHQTVRTPLPYGSPSAPAWVASERTFAARTPSGNAGTLTISVPSYEDVLETSFCAPPVPCQDVSFRRGAASTGLR